MKYEILNRFTGAVQFTAEIDCADDAPRSLKIGLAVMWGIEYGADLSGADLSRADLSGAKLAGAENAERAMAMTEILPREGEVIGWKKASAKLVKIRVPPEARRSNASGRKCRAEYVEVLEVVGGGVAVTNEHGPRTKYEAGKTVRADEWDANRWNECSHGIHFFLTREEAEAW